MIDISTGKEMTRRDFGKGLSAIIAAGVAPSIALGALPRGLGARCGLMGGEVTPPPSPYHGYVSDGLFSMYDGIDNVGTGVHDNSATIWKDLCGRYDMTNSVSATNGEWLNDGFYFHVTSGTNSVFWNSSWNHSALGQDFTFEIVLSSRSTSNNSSGYKGVMGQSVNLSGGSHHGLYTSFELGNRYIWFYSERAGVCSSYNESSLFPQNTIISYSVIYSTSSLKVKAYYKSNLFQQYARSATQMGSCLNTGLMLGCAFSVQSWGNSDGSGRCFNGNLYSARFYNRELTDQEIAANFAIDRTRFGAVA